MPEVEEAVEVAEKTESPVEGKAEFEPGTPEAEAQAVKELQAIIDGKKESAEEKTEAKEAEEDEKDKEEPAEVDESEEAKEQKTKAAAPESPSAGIPLKLALRAAKVMDETEVLEYSDDPKSLERVVSALERRAKDPSAQKPTAKAEDSEVDEKFPDLSEDEVAEPIAKWAKQVVAKIQEVVAENKAVKEAHENLLNLYTYNREGERFDRAVSKLGHTDLFGDGDIESLDEGSEQYKNRLELFKARSEVQAQYRAHHEKMPTEAKLVERAFRLAFAKTIEQNANKSLAEKLKAGAKKLSVPPTRRKAAANATPDEQARDAIQEILDRKKQ